MYDTKCDVFSAGVIMYLLAVYIIIIRLENNRSQDRIRKVF